MGGVLFLVMPALASRTKDESLAAQNPQSEIRIPQSNVSVLRSALL
jgi:hypothetical protein